MSLFVSLDRALAARLPGPLLKDLYPRGMRWFAEHGLFRGEHVVQTRYDFKIRVNRIDAIKWYLHYFGVFEPTISEMWARVLQPGDVVIDIGGNVGYHALLAARRVGPSGLVCTFEPARRVYAQLVENIALNQFANIDARQAAVTDSPGQIELFFAGENEQGSSSVVRREGEAELVEAVDFAAIMAMVPMERVRIIKIDVEGAESMVLAGLVENLDRVPARALLFLEIGIDQDGSALLAPLLGAGFVAYEIANEYRTSFYRDPPPPRLRPWQAKPRRLQDVVLCRSADELERFR